MPTEFVCPICQSVIANRATGCQGHCPSCGSKIVVPPPRLRPALPSRARKVVAPSTQAAQQTPSTSPPFQVGMPTVTPPAPFQWNRHNLLIVSGMLFTLIAMIAFFGTVIGYHLPKSTAMAPPPNVPQRTKNAGTTPATQATPASGSQLATPAQDKPMWAEFVDAGGRFRCQVPPGVTPRQIESATRSKVGFDTNEQQLGVIVRDSRQSRIDQSTLEELVDALKRNTANLGTLTVERQSLVKVKGATAAEVVCTFRRGNIKAYSRQIKMVQHGQDHVITTVTQSGNVDEVNQVFNQFVENYQSIDRQQDPVAGKEKALPADLDFTPRK